MAPNTPEKGADISAQIPALLPRPGRLGNPNMKVTADPRANPKLVAAFRAIGMDRAPQNPFANVSWEQVTSTAFMALSNKQNMKLYNMLTSDLPDDMAQQGIEYEKRTFTSFDGAERILHVFRPATAKGVLPGVVYIHGGGMVINDTASKLHIQWCRSIAAQGVVSFALDYRNAWTPEGHWPFPTGLNDCAAGVQYIAQHMADLGIDKIVLQGESGGGNLSIATALKAKQDGWLEQIAGVYACVPYISNGYAWSDERKLRELPSLYENDGYVVHCYPMAGMGWYYSQEENKTHPLAWPYYASVQDCEGLPPVVLSMDELDPLRDEGLAFYRKLLAAGVDVTAQVNLGITHGASLAFRQVLPEVYNKAVREIVVFAKSL